MELGRSSAIACGSLGDKKARPEPGFALGSGLEAVCFPAKCVANVAAPGPSRRVRAPAVPAHLVPERVWCHHPKTSRDSDHPRSRREAEASLDLRARLLACPFRGVKPAGPFRAPPCGESSNENILSKIKFCSQAFSFARRIDNEITGKICATRDCRSVCRFFVKIKILIRKRFDIDAGAVL